MLKDTPIILVFMQNFSPLLQFYANQIPDTHGRYIKDIWEFNHQKLEYTHNFIQ